jgi:hypothetical protein
VEYHILGKFELASMNSNREHSNYRDLLQWQKDTHKQDGNVSFFSFEKRGKHAHSTTI